MKTTKKEIDKKAKDLASVLNKHFDTNEWTPRVWDNVGWCYDVNCGSISVTETSSVQCKYFVLVSDEKNNTGGMPCHLTGEIKSFDNPVDAVIDGLDKLESYLIKLTDTLKDNYGKLNIVLFN